MRSKWWLSLCLVVLCCGALWAQSAGISVLVNGEAVNFDQPPMIVGGSVLVPMRGVFERLGADVVWVPDQRVVRATHGNTTIELQLGASTARINGQERPLTTPAMSVGGRTMVPLRFISAALGADVTWSPASRTVAITTVAAAAPPPHVVEGPRIERVTTDAVGPLRPGQTITVRLRGDEGNQATFDVQGVIQGVPMTEQAPGRYVGTVQIPYNAQVAQAEIVGHLVSQAGQSSLAAQPAEEAPPTPVEFAQVRPEENSTIRHRRPPVSVRVEGGTSLVPSSVRLTVDGHDVTSEINVSQGQITWEPSTDLPPGPVTVYVSARDDQGNRLSKEWSFTIEGEGEGLRIRTDARGALRPGDILTVTMEGEPGGQASFDVEGLQDRVPMSEVAPGRYVGTLQVPQTQQAVQGQVIGHLRIGEERPQRAVVQLPMDVRGGFQAPGYPGGSLGPNLPLQLSSPLPGSVVSDDFVISGQTEPGALVTIQMRLALGPDERQNVLNVQVPAQGNGYFQYAYQGRVPVRGGEYELTVTAVGQGRQSAPVVLQLARQ